MSAEKGQDFLAHYGVLGMKWGKRKAQFRNTETGAKTKGRYKVDSSSDHVKSREIKRKKSYQASNKELETLNKRLQLEKTRKQLDPSTTTKGHNAVKAVLAVAGTASAVYGFTQSPLGQKITQTVTEAMKK